MKYYKFIPLNVILEIYYSRSRRIWIISEMDERDNYEYKAVIWEGNLKNLLDILDNHKLYIKLSKKEVERFKMLRELRK